MDVINMLSDSGTGALVLLGMSLVSPLVAMAVTVTQLGRLRFPQVLPLLWCTSIAAVGFAGSWLSASVAIEAVSFASPELLDQMAAQGYAIAVLPGVLGAMLAVLSIGLVALGQAFGVLLRPGEKPNMTWGTLGAALLGSMVTVPLATWSAGAVGFIVATMLSVAFLAGSARYPHETDSDRARCASARLLLGFEGLLASLLLVPLVGLSSEWIRLSAHAQMEVPFFTRLLMPADASGLLGLGVLALFYLVLGTFLVGSRFDDIDVRGIVQGALAVLVPPMVLVSAAPMAWSLSALTELAVPWHELRAQSLADDGLRPPVVELEGLGPLIRADTLRMFGALSEFNDGPAPRSLGNLDRVNLELDPDVDLVDLAAYATDLEQTKVCLVVRQGERLACLHLVVAHAEEAEKQRRMVDGVEVDVEPPSVQLVPDGSNYVLMADENLIFGRGPLQEVARELPPATRTVRVWLAQGRTVEDLVDVARAFGDAGATPLLVWRTDAPAAVPRASTGDGTLEVEGMDPDVVREVVDRQRQQIGHCYQRVLENRAGVAGSFRVQFVIGPAGTVASTKVRESDLNDSEVERCVEARLRTMRFPRPSSGSAQVDFPFVFGPEPEAPEPGTDDDAGP